MRSQITINLSANAEKAFKGVKNDGFNVIFNRKSDELEIFLHGIVGDDFAGNDSQSMQKTLSADRSIPITLYVNSPGGLAYDGLAIYNALSTHKGPTKAIIEGMAGSAASFIVLACDTVHAYESAKFHPHYSMAMAMGHKDQIKDILTEMELIDQDLERIYSEKSGKDIALTKSHLQGPNGDGTVFAAKEAAAVGYIDTIISVPKKGKRACVDDQVHAIIESRLEFETLKHRLTEVSR